MAPPLQYSCLENPRDGGAWWAAVYGVAQSRTQLKRLSSSKYKSSGQEGTVRTGRRTTDWFQIKTGVHQGCISLPCFFNLYAEYIMRNAGLDEAQAGIKIQFSSVTQSCLTLCIPMDCSMPGLPVHHQVPDFAQTHVHWVNDAIQPSHPLSSPSPPAPKPSQHQGLFQWVSPLHQVPKVLLEEIQLFSAKCRETSESILDDFKIEWDGNQGDYVKQSLKISCIIFLICISRLKTNEVNCQRRLRI